MSELAQKHCVPCEGGALPLMRDESAKLLEQILGWTIAPDGLSISREFTFQNFVDAMAFANKVTPIAESESHHPHLTIRWGSVLVKLITDAIGGLSENDFILAAKINEIS